MKTGDAFRMVSVTVFMLLGLAIVRGGNAAPNSGPSTGVMADAFVAKCALCHGKDGRGLPSWRAKGQPDFTDAQWQKNHTDAQIAETIRSGKGKNMPSFKGKVSEAEITALVSRVRSFGKK